MVAGFHWLKNLFEGQVPTYRRVKVGLNQTITAGDVLAVSGGYAVVAAAGAAAGTILGVAEEAVTSTTAGVKDVRVNVSPYGVFEVNYTGATKTFLADTDLYDTAFDLNATADGINLDDTLGGFCRVIGYDNIKKTAHVIIGNRLFA